MNGTLAPISRAKPAREAAFANSAVTVRSWYVAGLARRVRRGRLYPTRLLGRRVVLWRNSKGQACAMHTRCPHLGADLSSGAIVEGRIRCPFHHWSFDAEGHCVAAPGQAELPERRATVYPTRERFGLVWIYNGQNPDFELPELPDGDVARIFRCWRPPSRRIRCHPHLVIANGLDPVHLTTLHGMQQTAPPILEQHGPLQLSLRTRGRPRSRALATLLGVGRSEIVARFTTLGSNIAWATIDQPVRFHVLFTARPADRGHAETQTVLFLPRGSGLVRAMGLIGALLARDRHLLDRLDFHAGFTSSDEPMRRFAEIVDGMERE